MNDYTLIIRYQQRMELLERLQASIRESQYKTGSLNDRLYKAIAGDLCALIEGDREENRKARQLIEEIKKEQLQGLSDLEKDALRFESFGLPPIQHDPHDEIIYRGHDKPLTVRNDITGEERPLKDFISRMS